VGVLRRARYLADVHLHHHEHTFWSDVGMLLESMALNHESYVPHVSVWRIWFFGAVRRLIKLETWLCGVPSLFAKVKIRSGLAGTTSDGVERLDVEHGDLDRKGSSAMNLWARASM
jgi:hypothetical protein